MSNTISQSPIRSGSQQAAQNPSNPQVKARKAKASGNAANEADTSAAQAGVQAAGASQVASSSNAYGSPEFLETMAKAQAQSAGEALPFGSSKAEIKSAEMDAAQASPLGATPQQSAPFQNPIASADITQKQEWISGKDPRQIDPQVKIKALDQQDMGVPLGAAGKPWSKNWVFTGKEDATPELKPLFGESKMESTLKELRAVQGAGPGAPGSSGLGISNHGISNHGKGEAAIGAELAGLLGEIGALEGLSKGLGEGFSSEVGSGELGDGLSSSGVSNRSARPLQLSGADYLETKNALAMDPKQNGNLQSNLQGFNSPSGSLAKDELSFGKPRPESFGEPISQLGNAGAGAAGVSALQASRQNEPKAIPMAQVTGHVVRGSMASQRLSHESLSAMSTQIRGMTTQGLGGGEMRLTLKPESLGEIKMQISTQGNNVGIKIHASDEKARKVLEDSVQSLKESLANQNLQLSRIDVLSVGGSALLGDTGGNSHNGSSQSQDPNLRQNGQFSMNQNGSGYQGDSSRGNKNSEAAQRWLSKDPGSALAGVASRAASARGSYRHDGVGGRLNVIA